MKTSDFFGTTNKEIAENKVSIKVEDYKNEFLLNKAIEKLIDYKGANRNDYNADEINFISYYSGYGGLGKYGTVGRELAKGLKYEFYTPDDIVKKMWGLAYKYGYGTLGDNSVFETSAGIGNFVKYAPKDVKVVCNEINKYSVKILEILYPDATIYLKYFEQNFITKDNKSMKSKIDGLDKYSLIIGNPPYGELTGKYIGMGEDAYTKAGNFCEYFITRSLDLLVQDGLLIYIVGAEQLNGGTLFLDSKMSKVKEIIFDKAHLIDAYRLPVKVFERTGVSSEILIFRKK
jgi:type I restriction-modification system DNA methylase subunit